MFKATLRLIAMFYGISVMAAPSLHDVTALEKSAPMIGLSFGRYYMNYKEEVEPPRKSMEKGVLHRFDARITVPTNVDSSLSLGMWVGIGDTDYDGSTQEGRPYQANTNHLVLSPNVLGEMRVAGETGRSLSLFGGLEYRYWRRDIGGSAGYVERYQMINIPLGARYHYQFSSFVSVAPEAGVKYLLWGDVKAYLSEKSEVQDVTMPLGSRLGFRIAVPFIFALTPNEQAGIHLSFAPWYERTGIGEGDKVPLITSAGGKTPKFVGEPASQNNQLGFDVGVFFPL